MIQYSWSSRAIAAAVVAGFCAVAIPARAQYAPAPNRDRAGAIPAAATPRTADGRPDLSGLWIVGVARPLVVDAEGNVIMNGAAREGSGANAERDGFLRKRMDPNRPVYKPEFWDKVQYLDDHEIIEDSYFHCNPLGVPRQGPPAKILQTAKEVVFLYEAPAAGGGRNAYRIIPIDKPHHPVAAQDQTWMGDSVARWEGETLVVDVVGFNDVSWLDIEGYFHTTALHVIERVRRDGDTLTYQATAEDPKVLMTPWVMNPVTLKLVTDPDAYIIEDYPCHERDAEHLVTTEHH
jgi:hypothetical protein